MNAWVIIITVAAFVAFGRQFYMNADSIIVISVLVFIAKWIYIF